MIAKTEQISTYIYLQQGKQQNIWAVLQREIKQRFDCVVVTSLC